MLNPDMGLRARRSTDLKRKEGGGCLGWELCARDGIRRGWVMALTWAGERLWQEWKVGSQYLH